MSKEGDACTSACTPCIRDYVTFYASRFSRREKYSPHQFNGKPQVRKYTRAILLNVHLLLFSLAFRAHSCTVHTPKVLT